MRILGHRGASASAPENTVPAFLEAMRQGADGVELDVMRCRTGELVVCHDEWLDRLAGLHLEVRATSWTALRRLDVGSALGFPRAGLPLLDEVLDALPDRAWVNVELKCDQVDDGGLSVEVARRLVDRRVEERVFVSSFNPVNLVRVAQAAPRLRRGLLIDPDRPWFPQAWLWLPVAASTSVHPHFSQVTPERMARWEGAGLEVAVWTVDDLDEARRLRALGVEWLITNRPGPLRHQLSGLPDPRPSVWSPHPPARGGRAG